MFPNNLPLTKISGTTSSTAVLVDGPTNRKTLRSASGSFPINVSIGHQPSTENGNVESLRSVVRFEWTKVDSTTGKEVLAYAQLVVMHPVLLDVFSQADVEDMIIALMYFLQNGGDNNFVDAVEATRIGNCRVVLARLLNGEP